MKKQNVAGVVETLLTPVVEELGYRLWDVEFRKVGADPTLTITIDSDDGITIEDCEKVHRTIDPLLDEADPIDVSYQLEVSSPGIERVIRTDAHIAFCMGEEIEARTFAPQNGKKSFVGVCASAEFATEEFLQSAVHGNSDTLMHLFGQMGKTHIPEGLTLKPFESTTISTVTTTQMWRWTLILAVTPAVVVTLAAVAILIKRRRA